MAEVTFTVYLTIKTAYLSLQKGRGRSPSKLLRYIYRT